MGLVVIGQSYLEAASLGQGGGGLGFQGKNGEQ